MMFEFQIPNVVISYLVNILTKENFSKDYS